MIKDTLFHIVVLQFKRLIYITYYLYGLFFYFYICLLIIFVVLSFNTSVEPTYDMCITFLMGFSSLPNLYWIFLRVPLHLFLSQMRLYLYVAVGRYDSAQIRCITPEQTEHTNKKNA